MGQVYNDLQALPPLMAVKDLQGYLNIGRRQVYELVHSEGFPIMRMGASIKIPRALLAVWIEEQVTYNLIDRR